MASRAQRGRRMADSRLGRALGRCSGGDTVRPAAPRTIRAHPSCVDCCFAHDTSMTRWTPCSVTPSSWGRWPQRPSAGCRGPLVDVADRPSWRWSHLRGPSKDYIAKSTATARVFDTHARSIADLTLDLARLAQGGAPMVGLFATTAPPLRRRDRRSRLPRADGNGTCIADYDTTVPIPTSPPSGRTCCAPNGDGTFSDSRHGPGPRCAGARTAPSRLRSRRRPRSLLANYLAFSEASTRARLPRLQYMGIDVMCGPRGSPASGCAHRNMRAPSRCQPLPAFRPGHYGFGVLFIDLTPMAGWTLLRPIRPHLLFRNNRNGTSPNWSRSGSPWPRRKAGGQGADAADYDGDGRLTFVTTSPRTTTRSIRTTGRLLRTSPTRLRWRRPGSLPRLGTGFADFDNDGLLDIFIANGHVYPEIDRSAWAADTFNATAFSTGRTSVTHPDWRRAADRAVEPAPPSRHATGDVDAWSSLNYRRRCCERDGGLPNWLALSWSGGRHRDAIGAVWLEDEGSCMWRVRRAAAIFLIRHADPLRPGRRTRVPPITCVATRDRAVRGTGPLMITLSGRQGGPPGR